MTKLAHLLQLPKAEQQNLLSEVNRELEGMSAGERITWALENLPGEHALSSSFGIQSAVSLHMLTRARADIPVLLADTGYLFPETYGFIDELKQRLELNLKISRSDISPAWQESRFGKLWEQGVDGLDLYNKLNKVEPMERLLQDNQVQTWFSGLRREQASSRQGLGVLAIVRGRFKVHPIIDWSNKDIHYYLVENSLPYHPLWDQGYVSVGDVHTSMPLKPGMTEEETRFFGLKRECGLHVDGDGI